MRKFERQMKKSLVAILFVCFTLGCESARERQDRIDRAQREFETTIAKQKSDLDAELLAEDVKLVTLRHGEAAGRTYDLCHTFPPTTKAHKLECERLDKQKARDDANAEKHPW